MGIPKSMNRCDRQEALKGHLKHEKKPDIDNLVKLVMDVLTGVVWDDDNCVQLGSAVKVYASSPRTEVIIEETTQLLTLNEVWEGTWPSHDDFYDVSIG